MMESEIEDAEQGDYYVTPDEFCAAKLTCPDFDDESCHVSGWGGDGCYIPWTPPQTENDYTLRIYH